MTQYAVTITSIVDSPDMIGLELERFLRDPGVHGFTSSVHELDADVAGMPIAGMPTVENRISALIEYLGNDRALHALESEVDRMNNTRGLS